MYTALGLQRKLRRARRRITVVDPQSYMTYQPFLPESAAGNLEPRHVVVPLRKVLEAREILTGRITVDRPRASRRRTIRAVRGRWPATCPYDVARARPGLDRAHAADPGPGRARHRLQDRRRSDLPAQPRAVADGPRRLDRRRAAASAGAHLRLRRRRLRRDRGDGRARGHGPRRAALLPRTRPRRTCGGCMVEASRADHARGQPRSGGVHRAPARGARHRGTPEHPGGVDGRRAIVLSDGDEFDDRHDRLDRRGAGQPAARGDRPAAR